MSIPCMETVRWRAVWSGWPTAGWMWTRTTSCRPATREQLHKGIEPSQAWKKITRHLRTVRSIRIYSPGSSIMNWSDHYLKNEYLASINVSPDRPFPSMVEMRNAHGGITDIPLSTNPFDVSQAGLEYFDNGMSESFLTFHTAGSPWTRLLVSLGLLSPAHLSSSLLGLVPFTRVSITYNSVPFQCGFWCHWRHSKTDHNAVVLPRRGWRGWGSFRLALTKKPNRAKQSVRHEQTMVCVFHSSDMFDVVMRNKVNCCHQ